MGGNDLRLGDTPEFTVGVPVEDRFLRPRFFPSCMYAWPQSVRMLAVRGLCLFDGECLRVPVAGEMVKMILRLLSLSGSEKVGSDGRSPLAFSANIF